MKRQIRKSVFETNSSSTHSLTICTEEEYNKWKNGEILFNKWSEKFVELKEYTLTDEIKELAMLDYNGKRQKYWKEWEELSEEEKEELYLAKIEEKKERDLAGAITYREYENDSWYDDLTDYLEYYTSPSGDKLVIFGKYGYDG